MNELQLDDELLCAYLDDELAAAERANVQAALERDPGARTRLERMRAADQRLRRDIPVKAVAPADPLAQYILNSERDSTALRRPRWRAGAAYLALAAGVTGVTLGFLLSRAATREDAGVMTQTLAAGPLREALDGRVSGEPLVAGDESIRVLLTLRGADGRTCRLFAAESPGRAGEGLACREAQGWQVLAWDATAGRTTDFRTAGASPVLDAAMDRMGGATLTPAEERVLLENHWVAPTDR